jgi:hypothetical protein
VKFTAIAIPESAGIVVAIGSAQVVNMRRSERQPATDQRPGAIPEITMEDGSLTFVMAPTGLPRQRHERLIIRCGADGEVFIAIEPEHVVQK